jgi:hypothetical protein
MCVITRLSRNYTKCGSSSITISNDALFHALVVVLPLLSLTTQSTTYVCVVYPKVKYITWALRSTIVFLHTLKTYLIVFGNLKLV